MKRRDVAQISFPVFTRRMFRVKDDRNNEGRKAARGSQNQETLIKIAQ